MNDAITKVSKALDAYKFNEAAKELYDFVWGDFCDWYVEISKVTPNIAVLDEVFGTILRLLHPYAPFITEELWNDMGYGDDTIQRQPWPQTREVAGATAELSAKVNELYEVVGASRQLRNEYGIPPKQSVKFVYVTDRFTTEDCQTIMRLLGECEIQVTSNYVPQGVTPSLVTRAATVFMVGAVDVETERLRLKKQLADIEKQLAATVARLRTAGTSRADEGSTAGDVPQPARAAPIAVQREREKQQQLREQREKLQALLKQLG